MASQDGKSDLYRGFALGAVTLVALILANSPVASQYEAILQAIGEIRIGWLALSSLNSLMAIFFLLMAFEIKREVLEGELTGLRGAMLPGGSFVMAD